MLRLTFIPATLIILLFTPFFSAPRSSQSTSIPLQVTTTSEERTSLNPAISGDGSHIAFESTGDLTNTGGVPSFRTYLANIAGPMATFSQIALSRAVSPAISQDGTRMAFASTEDLVGRNPDRNSEIFLFDGNELKQITETIPDDHTRRLQDGSSPPSISDDGLLLAFSSNRDLVGQNADKNFEIFFFDLRGAHFTQITSSIGTAGSTHPKLSGDASTLLYLTETEIEQTLVLHDLKANAIEQVATGNFSLAPGRAISDDGQRVVYSNQQNENQTQVYLYDRTFQQTRQITTLGSRVTDVPLNPTISGDGKRIVFATRRSVIGQNSDNSVELYMYDIPTVQFTKLTNASARAIAEVVASLNDDGSRVVFNFPRVLTDSAVQNDHANNSEIYLLSLADRLDVGELTVLNGATKNSEPGSLKTLAPESIAIARGNALASGTQQAMRDPDGSFPSSLLRTTMTVSGRPAQLLFVSPTQINFVVPPAILLGQSEIIVTNADGFQSIANVQIAPVSPGLFTTASDGRGEGIALNADTFLAGPFDPSDGQLRLSLFATGVRNAGNVSLTIGGQALTPEAIVGSPDLSGLDEIHFLVPSDLRGAGIVDLVVTADGTLSNSIQLTLSGSPLRDIMINEILADPPDGLNGDANGDGVRDSSHDEFVELVNTTAKDLDIGGFQLMTRSPNAAADSLRHRFPLPTILPAGGAIVVFGGGNPDPTDPRFQNAMIVKASSGGLSLLNSGGVVTLRDTGGSTINVISYGGNTGLRGDQNQSLTRAPDINGPFVLHQSAEGSEGRLFSPGSRVDGTPFLYNPPISLVVMSPNSAMLAPGEEQHFSAIALDHDGRELSDVIFQWRSSDTSVATISNHGLARGVAPGTSLIMASARGVNSSPVPIVVVAPSPSPSPTAAPTPEPTPSPSPSASPTPMSQVVISEFRTRGPSGASDEFIELYNTSDVAIPIGGWKLRGSSSTGTVTNRLTIAAHVIIPPRGHFLAVHSGYTGAVAGDQSYASGISNDGGIALTLPDDTVVDQVGLSPGSAFKEGMHLAPLVSDADQSYERRPGGDLGSTQDENDNFSDFRLLTPSNPQNLSSPPTPGPVSSPTPQPSPEPTPSPSPTPVPSPSAVPEVVISQIFGGGGNSGAPFRNDFIEIFNRGTNAVDLAGWSVQYSSATGSAWSVTLLSVSSLQPGQYYLIQQGSGGSNGASLPTPDAVGSIAMAAGSGKVALVSDGTALSGSCPSSNSIRDLVGYGNTASCFRGVGPTSGLSSTTAALRSSNGCTDTQSNVVDFIIGPPAPRNSAAGLNVCSISEDALATWTEWKKWTRWTNWAGWTKWTNRTNWTNVTNSTRPGNHRTTPISGLDALAYRRLFIRPAKYASRPASIANFIARAIRAGS